ncbi:T9SS type A sorting domain-containing protein [Emticicia sp. SJ17W-69]|uniref:type IX secretion system anionic LPS delivery protein PorZ n=1 Tax=Emticicia sp. SJ17W-69 TaxID=3421657 RepID=UPI003EB98EFA
MNFNNSKNSFSLLTLPLLSLSTFAQIPTNTWRTHADYSNAKGVEIVDNNVFCFSKNGLFFFNKSDDQVVTLSKINGFSETKIAQIRYSSELKKLLVAYETGNLDIVSIANGTPDQIQNIDFIKKTDAIQGSKFINQIEFKGDFAYLAADFGLVVLDVKKSEIKETYQNIGNEGRQVSIKQLTFARDSIFVNTSGGILGAKFDAKINLQFFGNWQQFTAGDVSHNQLFKPQTFPKDILAVSPNEIATDIQSKVWIADGENGLVSNFSGIFKTYSPNSIKGDIFEVYYQNQKIYAAGFVGYAFEENEWKKLNINQLPSNSKDVIDRFGYRWQIVSNGLRVTNNTTNQSRYFYAGKGSGNLPSSIVNSIVEDKDNLVWVGTANGVAVISTSKDIFTTATEAYTPFFQTRRLLLQEVVTKIVVDGGNRKWIATQNGLNLFSASADEQIFNFTEENSPLPSKNILDLALDPVSGEIFVLTENGLLSYRSNATEPNEDLDAVKIFPNPIRPDYQGVMTISGLRENTTIKITDASGRLIYETKSNGGTASWNLQNPQGNSATSGIYLVFCIAEDGSESFVGKVAVVR